MGNTVSIFTTTPQEHADKFWASQYQRVPFLFKGMPHKGYISRSSLSLPSDSLRCLIDFPRRYVRCKFYLKFEKHHFARQCDIREDVALLADGSLDLRDVKRKWGLQEIQTIDPARWIPFDSNDSNRLSRLAVEILTDVDKALHFYEPSCPPNVARIRSARLLAVKTKKQAIHNLFGPLRFIDTLITRVVATPHFKRHEGIYIWMVLLMLSVLFFSSMYFGVAACQFQSRFRNVVRTGSFAVSPVY